MTKTEHIDIGIDQRVCTVHTVQSKTVFYVMLLIPHITNSYRAKVKIPFPEKGYNVEI